MRIPKKVKIGGLTYKVETTERLTLGCDYSAEILYDRLLIHISPQAKERMEADFWHEVVHGIYHRLGYREHDEKHIEELAQSIYAFIKDNPQVFKEGAEKT